MIINHFMILMISMGAFFIREFSVICVDVRAVCPYMQTKCIIHKVQKSVFFFFFQPTLELTINLVLMSKNSGC